MKQTTSFSPQSLKRRVYDGGDGVVILGAGRVVGMGEEGGVGGKREGGKGSGEVGRRCRL